MVEAAERYGKIVQVGTMNRSRPAVRQAIKLHPRGRDRQGLHGARPLLQAAPVDRQVPRRTHGPRRNLQAQRGGADRTSLPTTRPTSPGSTTTSGRAPPPPVPSTATASTTTGTGTGTTATAIPATRAPTSSTSPAGASTRTSIPCGSRRWAGTSGSPRRRRRRTRRPRSSSTRTARVLEFGTRGEYTNDEGSQRIGNLFYGNKGWLLIDGDGREWQSYLGRKNEKGPGSTAPPESGGSDPRVLTSIGVPALPELHRRDPRERPLPADLRHPRRPPLRGPGPPRQHRLPGEAGPQLRRGEGAIRGRRGGRRAADPALPHALRRAREALMTGGRSRLGEVPTKGAAAVRRGEGAA